MSKSKSLWKRVLSCLILFVPDKKVRRDLRNRYVYGFDDTQLDVINNNYKKNIERIRAKIKTDKIKVGFLVSENQKWNCQSVYEKMMASEDFEPIILITKVYSDKHEDFGKFYTSVSENYEYFKSKGMNVEYAYDIETKEYIGLDKFNIDILFYQQPWAIAPNQNISVTSEFALTCYVPYFVAITDSSIHYDQIFHRTLWQQYSINELVCNEYKRKSKYPLNNYQVVGHPKFDTYLSNEDIENEGYIIYAPHHSFAPSHLNFATFQWNGKYILEYAKEHPEFKFVFKPHPQLKTRMIKRKIMSEKEVDNYFEEWKKIAVFCNDADYYDLFKKSRLMITDCSSFLGEYFPTKNPVINLKNKNSIKFNPFGQAITDCYYKVYDLKTLKSTMKMLLEDNLDPMKEQRLARLKELDIVNTSTAERILNVIKESIS
ncbi:CDP-glycerol glycerophosphotransferase family protein [bacterium]|nr:CDP-glycerol glycerophosphotransferase family protein [bacterium]